MNTSFCRKIMLLAVMFISSIGAMTQRFNFVSLGVENGLVQSQVNSITQDKQGMLWIATLGGISRYDGSEFCNYSKENGLLTSFVYKIYADSKNKIWIGTQDGLQCFDGKKYTAYGVNGSPQTKFILSIAEAPGNHIYFITGENKLYRVQDGIAKPVFIEDSGNFITAIQKDQQGTLHAIVHNKGIYVLIKDKWKPVFSFSKKFQAFYFSKLFFEKSNNTWLLSGNGAFKIAGKKIYPIKLESGTQPNCLSIQQDKVDNTWIGTMKGAYKISPQGTVSYTGAENGFTDNAIHDIYRDREDNLWFASDGNGIHKYTDNSFSFFDKTTGLPGEVVMGIIHDKTITWIGTAENGLSKYDGKTFHKVRLPSANPQAQKINALLMGSSGTLWIGTIGGGLWQYQNGHFSALQKKYPDAPADISTLYEDNDHTTWITSPSGCYFYSAGHLKKVSGLNIPCFSVYQLSKDSILIGTTDGIKLLQGKTNLSRYDIPGTETTTIGQLKRWNGYLAIATFEKGLWLYHAPTKKIYKCTKTSGLSSDMLFSLLPDGDFIYTGTVNGINKVSFDKIKEIFHVTILRPFNQLLGPECNQNVILKDTSGKIWVGTTKGILIFNPKISTQKKYLPFVYLDGVQLFSEKLKKQNATDTTIAWKQIPYNLVLKPNENHLTFQLKGVYLTNPDALQYQFMLEGADTGFSAPANSPLVIYSNLAPGKYIFKAKALVENGLSSNTIEYPVEIKPPFYKTVWFQLLGAFFLLSIGALYQQFRMKIKAKRKEMLNKIRTDEQVRIQQKTSEDLHDDLGNKITRISLLTDILQGKTDPGNDENKRILQQIKENTQALYTGTKDIIWALNPENNSLQHFFQRIKSFGADLFDDTSVEFACHVNDEIFSHIKLPLDYNRNMIMILKEALTNILRHAAARHAEIKVNSDILMPKGKNTLALEISIKDDGVGIPLNNNRKGYGLDNMRKRLERINGQLRILYNLPTGTILFITINIPLE